MLSPMRLPLPLLIAFALVLVLGVVAFLVPNISRAPTPPSAILSADSPAHFSFELATTPEAREQGLSGRTNIPHNYGMLFVFNESGTYGFWMKDMKESIDIIWLDEHGTILGIEHAVAPESFPDTFYPPTPARFVLETRAGESELLEWNAGDSIALPIP